MKLSADELEELYLFLESKLGIKPLIYIKFTQSKKFAQDIIDGNLYSNSPSHFRNQEITSGIRGQGDKSELLSELILSNIKIFNKESEELLLSSPGGEMTIRFKDDDNRAMVSFIGFNIRDFNINITETEISLSLPFSKDEINKMQSTFGDYCAILTGNSLQNAIENYSKDKNIDYIFDKIIYCEQNRIDRLQSFNTGNKNRFIYKNSDLSYQNEYRLALSCDVPTDHFLRLGKIEGIIIDSKNLGDYYISISYHKK